MNFEWKWIWSHDSGCENTYRAKVFGGWLVRHEQWMIGENKHVDMPASLVESMVFVPGPEHKWEISDE